MPSIEGHQMINRRMLVCQYIEAGTNHPDQTAKHTSDNQFSGSKHKPSKTGEGAQLRAWNNKEMQCVEATDMRLNQPTWRCHRTEKNPTPKVVVAVIIGTILTKSPSWPSQITTIQLLNRSITPCLWRLSEPKVSSGNEILKEIATRGSTHCQCIDNKSKMPHT